jgi:putative transposase
VYYTPQSVSASDLALMRRIDERHLNHPFAGARMLRARLAQEGVSAGRRHVARLMKKMGIEALYRRPHTRRKHPQNPVFPYLLRGLESTRANHGWAMDITYIPMRKGFVYRAAVLDWATRRVLSWRLSNTLTTDFCLEAVEDAWDRYGIPEILNTDPGSQFTSTDFVNLIQGRGIRLSMDGKGRWVDNVFVERLWKSVKYEEIHLHAYDAVTQARQGLERYFTFYNQRRPHSSRDGKTPDQVYFNSLSLPQAA